MSHFTSSFWDIYITVLTLGSVIACAVLLKMQSARKVSGGSKETTGHTWDETLGEYNNPLPRWWLVMFVLSVLFALGYLAFYPGLGNFAGRLQWDSNAQMQQQLAQVQAARNQRYAEFFGKPLAAVAVDPAARALGRGLFMNNCAGCHGADAQGALGFPNLADRDWLYGGTPETILASIRDGRAGQMPNFNAVLKPEVVGDLVSTLARWSDPKLPADVRERGMRQFSYTCAACHGPDGRGNPAIGAPNLTDTIWLHGGSYEQLRQTVLFGRHGNMPAHRDLLTSEEIHLLAAYVYGLSIEP